MIVDLTISLPTVNIDMDDGYDLIKILRSENGGVSYSEITRATAEAATLLGTQVGPFTINGLTLILKVEGGSDQTVTFAAADPVAIGDAITEILAQTTGVGATDDGGALRLSSLETGTYSRIEIVGGTALTALGLSVGDYDQGHDARLSLVRYAQEYEFRDWNAEKEWLYQYRLYNSTDATDGDVVDLTRVLTSVLDAAELVTGIIKLIGPSGDPMADTVISFYTVYYPTYVVSNRGLLGPPLLVTTDEAGEAEALLVKGAVMDVAIAGTNMTRRITIPSTGAEFDVVSALGAADDNFQVQEPDVPAAVRRTL